MRMMRMRWVLASAMLMMVVMSAHEKTAQGKLEFMKRRAAKASNHLIRLDAEEWKNYVMKGPRSYNVVTIFTAIAARFSCTACQTFAKDTPAVASAVYAATSSSDSPVFVVELDFDYKDIGQLYNDLGMNNAPLVMLSHPYEKENAPQLDKFISKLSHMDKYDFNVKGMKGEAFVEWINKKTDANAVFHRAIDFMKLFYDVGLPLLALAIPLAIMAPTLWRKRQNTSFYMLIAFGIYLFSVSGGMYNILKETPWAATGDDGKTSYIHGGNGWQLTSESYICGGVQLLLGILIIFLNTYAVQFESKTARNLFSSGAVLIILFLWDRVRGLVSFKMGGYNHGWVYNWI